MAHFKLIGTVTPNAASNTSLTSVFTVPGEMAQFAVQWPASMLITATGNVRILGGSSPTDTFSPIVYSNNPATSTTGNAFAGEMSYSTVASGAFVINEAIAFAPYIQFNTTNTMTANAGIGIYGRKFD